MQPSLHFHRSRAHVRSLRNKRSSFLYPFRSTYYSPSVGCRTLSNEMAPPWFPAITSFNSQEKRMTTHSRDFRFADSFYLKPGNADNSRIIRGRMSPRKMCSVQERRETSDVRKVHRIPRSRAVPEEMTDARHSDCEWQKELQIRNSFDRSVRLAMEEFTACRARKGSYGRNLKIHLWCRVDDSNNGISISRRRLCDFRQWNSFMETSIEILYRARD